MPHSPLELSPWQLSFYNGQRLAAEVKLLAAKFNGEISSEQLVAGSRVLHTSYGVTPTAPSLSPFQEFQETLSKPQSLAESRAQYLSAPDCPDALMFWVLAHFLPSKQLSTNAFFRLETLRRLALLTLRFPKRPDLPYQLLLLEPLVCYSKCSQVPFWFGRCIQMRILFLPSYRCLGAGVMRTLVQVFGLG